MLLDLLFGVYRQRALTQLAEVGLLQREKQGNQLRYHANRSISA